MNNLAPLTTLLGPGAEGGHEFERLINQLLLSYADKQGFLYEPSGGAGADAGLDGLAPNGRVPGMDGPVGFQCKWLWDHLDKGSKARQIEDSLQRASKHFERIRHWVLVTPHDLTLNEQEWFNQLSQSLGLAFHDSREMSDDYQLRIDLRLHHWGKQKIESLLPLCPPLFARYYPQAAREQLSVHAGVHGLRVQRLWIRL